MNPYNDSNNHAIKFVEILNQPMYMSYIKKNKKNVMTKHITECGRLSSDIMNCFQRCQFNDCKEDYGESVHNSCKEKLEKMYKECNRATTDIFFTRFTKNKKIDK